MSQAGAHDLGSKKGQSSIRDVFPGRFHFPSTPNPHDPPDRPQTCRRMKRTRILVFMHVRHSRSPLLLGQTVLLVFLIPLLEYRRYARSLGGCLGRLPIRQSNAESCLLGSGVQRAYISVNTDHDPEHRMRTSWWPRQRLLVRVCPASASPSRTHPFQLWATRDAANPGSLLRTGV